jgi:amino acid transporter
MKKSSYLSLTALVLLSTNAVLNIRGLPIFAHIGLQALGFYILATIGFLIPSSLVCAELASRVGTSGGVYAWVRAAFGEKIGFLGIWLEWINNIIAFPATLSTISATLFYLIFPDMTQHRVLFFSLMMLILWGLSSLNLRGVRVSVWFSAIGAIFGTVIPGIIVILLGLSWWLMGEKIGFLQHPSPIFPEFNFSSLSLWVGVMGALSGMQITAFHLGEIKNPQKIFPKVMAIATLLIIALSLGAIFAMSAVVAPQELNVLSGVIQMYQVFFEELHLKWVLSLFVILLALGMMASMSAWMLGPARGLQVAAESGHLPRWFAKLNPAGMPKNILITQALISSLFGTVFVWMPTLKEAFWMLVALTSQFTVLMYVLIFASLLKLNFVNFNFSLKIPAEEKQFRIWGGFPSVCVVAGLGLISCAVAFLIGIFPPTQLGLSGAPGFIEKMLWVDGLILIFPYLFNFFKK